MTVERTRDYAVHARVRAGDLAPRNATVAVEEPLEIRVEGEPLLVVMRTPGHDHELTAGLLVAEEILRDRSDLVAVAHCKDPDDLGNVINVRLAADVRRLAERKKATRDVVTASSCGLCGKRTIASLHASAPPFEGEATLDPALAATFPEAMRAAQEIFDRTGGLHAAAIFDGAGRLVVLREDVGRHNAVDKCVGTLFLADRLGEHEDPDLHLMVSGRASYEIVQKALVARVRSVCSVSAPSSLAVDLARASRMALAGFVRGEGLTLYAGTTRFSAPAPEV